MDSDRQCEFEAVVLKLMAGDLPEQQQEALFSHLAQCPQCRQRFDEEIGKDTFSHRDIRAAIAEQPVPEKELMGLVSRLRAERRGDSDPLTGAATAEGDAIEPISELSLDFLSPPEVPQALGMFAGYDVLSVIGCGAMGIVFKAHDRELDRIVALKVLRPELAANGLAQRRFVSEARKAAAVMHDHVVTIHGVGESNGLPYIVMGYVVGSTLQERIRRTGPLKTDDILRIGAQAARGLAAAHDQGLIHRDIKPANILLENGVERVKIADFGLARAMDDMRMTQTGVITGTPEYMAPEQTSGRADERSDLFSLGAVMYAMCTGRSPFRADSIVQAIRRVNEDTPRPICEVNRECPDWLCEIIERLLEKTPDDRFQSAREVADLLQNALAGRQRPSGLKPRPRKRQGSPSPIGRFRLRHVAFWTAAVLLLTAVALMVNNYLKRPGALGSGPIGPPSTPRVYVQRIANCEDPEARQALIDEAVDVYGRRIDFWQDLLESTIANETCHEPMAIAAYDVCKYAGSFVPLDQEEGETCRARGFYSLTKSVFDDLHERYLLENKHEQAGWVQFRLMRLYSELHDYERAEHSARNAVQCGRQVESLSDFARNCFDAGLVLSLYQVGGKESEYQPLALKPAMNVQKGWEQNTITRADPEESFHGELVFLSGTDVDAHAMVELFSDAMQQDGPNRAYVAGLAYERLGNLDEAIKHYEYAARHRDFNTYGGEGFGQRFEERMLRLLLERGEAARAEAIFADLVAQRDRELQAPRATKAFARIRLAEVILQQRKDPQRVNLLLDEAEQILRMHELTPPHVFESIAALRAAAN